MSFPAILTIVGVVAAAVIVCAIAAHRMARRKRMAVIGFSLFAYVGVFVGWVFYIFMPLNPVDKPLLVAQATADDGQLQMCVVQSFNADTEPYTVSFYYKVDDGPWIWNYIDHQDSYWWSGSIEVEDTGPNPHVDVLKHGEVVATFDLNKMRQAVDGFVPKAGARGSRAIDGEPLDPKR